MSTPRTSFDRAAEKIACAFDHAGVPLRDAVAASKVPWIRAATVSDGYTAHQSVEHDDLNVLCLGGRVIAPELARELVRTFAAARFSGAERHLRRPAEVAEIEHDDVARTRATSKETEA